MIALKTLFVWKQVHVSTIDHARVMLQLFYENFYKKILPNEEKIVEFSVTDYY